MFEDKTSRIIELVDMMLDAMAWYDSALLISSRWTIIC